MNPLPTNLDAWIDEIGRAFFDAVQTLPFSAALGDQMEVDDLFHLAPHIALRFRRLRVTKKRTVTATEAALTSYVANIESQPDLGDPLLAFSFCYLAAHFGLNLVSEEEVEALMHELVARRRDIQCIVDRELDRFRHTVGSKSGGA